MAACVCAKSLQSCLTLCDPMDCSPPGSTVHGILKARILEWAAISFSNAIPRALLTLHKERRSSKRVLLMTVDSSHCYIEK